jgi:hypothetical protein
MSRRLPSSLTLLAGATFALVFPASPARSAAQGTPNDSEASAFFDKQVLPILKANCFKCHGEGKMRGGLSLASRAGLIKGGDLGPVISWDQPEESLLLKAISYKGDLQMPPGSKLTEKEIDILTRWVKSGAPYPAAGAVAATPGSKGLEVTAQDRDYWAYRPVQRPHIPPVQNKDWLRNPIDAFILAKLEAKGLSPASPADRLALARRLHYNLIGLPPAPEDLDTFVNDNAADAYERLIDRLLASPHYGEKWARHWLDLVRYAETNGFEFDQPKPFVWRYRDYVIAALNQDKAYDQFVREQIAGDLLDVVNPETLVATGYYRLGQWDSGAADRLLQRYDVLDGIVSTTGQVFLGMSLGCVRCHDHKKDPIPHRDYYRFLAFFHNISEMGGRKSTRRIAAFKDGPGMEVLCVAERGQNPTHILLRGNPRAHGERVEAGLPEVLSAVSVSTASSGGRLALARWLTDPANPLTARVMVNRLWQHHFGRGIVPTPNDFGKLGDPPAHPELLDWLASEFVAGGWKIKPIQRLILTSSAYRMSSKANDRALRIDPANTLLWRFNMRRQTAEEVRDSMLAVSGRLNLKMGGPSIYPPLPKEVLASQARPGRGWQASEPEEAARRSVYVHIKRSLLVPILALFDVADTDASCPVRFTTTVPTQALGLLNGAFSNEQAAALARRLSQEAPQDLEAQVRRAIRLTVGLQPSMDEVNKDVGFIRVLQQQNQLPEAEALRLYCLMLVNANEFLYLD